MYFIDLDVPKDSEDKSGDSTLVVSPDGKTMLIDCGHPDAGKDVVRLLRSLGIDKIDIVVISHHANVLGKLEAVCKITCGNATVQVGGLGFHRALAARDLQTIRACTRCRSSPI